jgi:DNA-directed RNA polymerase subunit RPC12/RpoP
MKSYTYKCKVCGKENSASIEENLEPKKELEIKILKNTCKDCLDKMFMVDTEYMFAEDL